MAYCHNLLTGNENFYDSHYVAFLECNSSHISLKVKDDFQHSNNVKCMKLFWWNISLNKKNFGGILLRQGTILYYSHNLLIWSDNIMTSKCRQNWNELAYYMACKDFLIYSLSP